MIEKIVDLGDGLTLNYFIDENHNKQGKLIQKFKGKLFSECEYLDNKLISNIIYYTGGFVFDIKPQAGFEEINFDYCNKKIKNIIMIMNKQIKMEDDIFES